MRTLRNFTARLRRGINRLLFSPRIETTCDPRLVRLGSNYGGWGFLDDPQLRGCCIVSAGLGEDASFDVEFARRYEARVCIVDPTPRAIAHFQLLVKRLGNSATVAYSSTGSQPHEAYELTQIAESQLELVPNALTDRDGIVRLYAPPDPQHVSYSILNFQNSYSRKGEWLEVPSIDIASLFQSITPSGVTLLKLDIEGAETLVVPRLLASGVPLPNQVLIEFDELNVPSRRSKRSFNRLHSMLIESGYIPVFWDKRSCVSYAHTRAFIDSRPHD